MKTQLYLQISKDGGRPCHRGGEDMVGSTRVGQEGRGKKFWTRAFIVVSPGRKGEGKVNRLV